MKMKFKNKIILWAVTITFIPLLLSYIIFITAKISDTEDSIKVTLKNVGNVISQSDLVREKLYKRESDKSIQEYTKEFI